MMGEMVVVVRLDRVTFSVLEVKVKLESGSVVFMLSWPWMEKRTLDWRSMFVCVVSLCQSATAALCLASQA